jgi:RimJ/RimL family protein N-acetyltransferase
MYVELTTERLLLRPFVESDFEAVHAYASDPEVCRYVSFGPNTEEDTRAFLERAVAQWQQDSPVDYAWAVTRRDQAALIGSCGLHLHAGATYQASLGYVYHRDVWGQGYGTEAARAVVGFGFRELGLHRVYAYYFVPNVGSGRIMEKLGMRYEGCLREATCKDGKWYDLLAYGILEREWHPGETPAPPHYAPPRD